MSEQYRICRSDDDYARYAQFYIRHYPHFSKGYTLVDALMHMLESMQHARIMLIEDESGQVISWGHYRFCNAEGEPNPSGTTVFIDSVVVDPARRSNRLFVRGFRQLLQCIEEDNPAVQNITFNALADNAYLNRLYGKFAAVSGERSGMHGPERSYAASFAAVKRYMQRF